FIATLILTGSHFKNTDRISVDESEVLCSVFLANASSIFAKRHIKTVVKLILYLPMVSDSFCEHRRTRPMTCDVEGTL
ncbi:MAG: hypothetical protein AAF355_12445, partial [Myxococcota bacterium]